MGSTLTYSSQTPCSVHRRARSAASQLLLASLIPQVLSQSDPTQTTPSPSLGPVLTPTTTATADPAILSQLNYASISLIEFLEQKDGCAFVSDLGAQPSLDMAALWLRAIFHDGGTWDPVALTGGLDGSLVNELVNSTVNLGLAGKALASNIVAHGAGNTFSHGFNDLSDADCIALGAHVTLAHCGGPNIPFRYGRTNVPLGTQDDVALLASNDSAPLADLLPSFYRMGLTKLDMLILVSGSHSLGGAHAAITPSATNKTFAPFDTTPQIFDNDIFVRMTRGECLLNVDCQLMNDPDLHDSIRLFASNQSAFFDAYVVSMTKMLEFNANVTNLSPAYQLNIMGHAFMYDTNVSLGVPAVATSGGAGVSVTGSVTSTAASVTGVPLSQTTASSRSAGAKGVGSGLGWVGVAVGLAMMAAGLWTILYKCPLIGPLGQFVIPIARSYSLSLSAGVL
ncbi:hypothetical protein HK101_004383 [Irineochytrium annulatum]|nr:hypothetical protein HK101_004383 [Irineochytrium annulatum]